MKPLIFKDENINERARKNLSILEAIRRTGPISKADISRKAGVNVVTVSNYVDHYIHADLVNVKSLDVSTGGRRPALLELNSSANYVIGIGLNLLDLVGVVTDLNGRIIYRIVRDRPVIDAARIIDYAAEIVEGFFETMSPDERKKVQGIGVGIAGVVDAQNGTIRWPQKMNDGQCVYSSLYAPFKETLEQRFQMPCILENDATVSCFGEQWLSFDAEVKNLIYMFSGVGSGLLLNGEVYRGATGSAGEITLKNNPEISRLDELFCDSYFLKPWEDDLGMVRHVRQHLEKLKESTSQILDLTDGKLDRVNLRHVFRAAQAGDALAMDVVRQAGLKLGIKVAFLVNLLNPQVVIIGGGMEEGGPPLLNAVREAVMTYSFDEMAKAVRILPSHLGNNAVALGAASLVVREIFMRV